MASNKAFIGFSPYNKNGTVEINQNETQDSNTIARASVFFKFSNLSDGVSLCINWPIKKVIKPNIANRIKENISP